MRQNSTEAPAGIDYLVGDSGTLRAMAGTPAMRPFLPEILDFLNDVSKNLMADRRSRQYSDVITFAFWIRKSSTSKLRERFERDDGCFRLGRGVAFHIAPSNVPVNYAYSLASGLITGNANVVRVPTKDFPQVEIINDAVSKALAGQAHAQMRPYICLVRYGRERSINDYLSNLCDVRVIWGGDETIAEIRKSSLRPRAGEITFADRFSMAVIDSDAYMAIENKAKTAEDFYNDTYFTDQNACTSPRIVIWTGGKIYEAKTVFWAELHKLVASKYPFQPIQAVNKLTSACLLAAATEGITIEAGPDNLIVRCALDHIPDGLMDMKDNSGFFFEYNCDDILKLRELCNDDRCQTVSYIGEAELLRPLLNSAVRGIDRVVSVGKTMDFDLIWDGYDLYDRMTRAISTS